MSEITSQVNGSQCYENLALPALANRRQMAASTRRVEPSQKKWKAWELEAMTGHHRLTGHRRLTTDKWIQALDPGPAFMLQIGANDHSTASKGHATSNDPGPMAVRAGWEALLLEPVKATFERLKQAYALNVSHRLRIENAGVCDRCTPPSQTIWTVDVTNRTGNWGSKTADSRCGPSWLTEIASLSEGHLSRHQDLLRFRPKLCSACSERLGRKLSGLLPAPPSLLRSPSCAVATSSSQARDHAAAQTAA